MMTDEQAETIVLLHRLTGMSIVNAVYAVIPNFNQSDFGETAAFQIKLTDANRRLDKEFKKTHSQHTHQGVDHDQKR